MVESFTSTRSRTNTCVKVVENQPLRSQISTCFNTLGGEEKILGTITRETKMRIPLWYHPWESYYDVLLDDIMCSARLGCLQINKKGFRYVKVPIGKTIAVGEDQLKEMDDSSKEVILNG